MKRITTIITPKNNGDNDDDNDDNNYKNNGDNNDDNDDNNNYIKILESDWSSAGLISAVIGQLHTSCACNWTVVRVMPE